MPPIRKFNASLGRVDFDRVREAALRNALAICRRVLPGGVLRGREYEARNPRRADRRPGSFRVNIDTGRWADFATGDRGGDLIGLVAFVMDVSRLDAARWLAGILWLDLEGA